MSVIQANDPIRRFRQSHWQTFSGIFGEAMWDQARRLNNRQFRDEQRTLYASSMLAIVVGIGTSGISAIRKLKADMVEAHERGKDFLSEREIDHCASEYARRALDRGTFDVPTFFVE